MDPQNAFSDPLEVYICQSNITQINQDRLSDCVEFEKTLPRSPNPMLLSISKQTFTKLPGQLMPMTGFTSATVSHPKIKLNQTPLREELRLCSFSLSLLFKQTPNQISQIDQGRPYQIISNLKRNLFKLCHKFLVFSSVIKTTEFSLPNSYQHDSMEVK